MENNLTNVMVVTSKVDGKPLSIYDKELAYHTEKIRQYQGSAVYSVLAIANELNVINNTKLFEKAGFKSITEYGVEVFDFKKSTISLYIKVAETFIESVDEETLTINFKENLPALSLGQLQELIPLANQGGLLAVRESFEDCTLNQKMSTKDMRKIVRDLTDSDEKKEEKAKLVTPLKKACKVKEPTEKSTPDQIASYVLANLEAAQYALESVLDQFNCKEITDAIKLVEKAQAKYMAE